MQNAGGEKRVVQVLSVFWLLGKGVSLTLFVSYLGFYICILLGPGKALDMTRNTGEVLWLDSDFDVEDC